MHQNVRHAAGDLPPGKRRGKRGVHDGKDRAVIIRIEPALLQNGLVGEDGGVARLAAGGRDGENDADGRALFNLLLSEPEVPDVDIRICLAVGDCLRSIDDAAAADGKNQLCVHGDCLFDALARQPQVRVRLHAAERVIRNARAAKKRQHPVQKTAFLCTVPAVDHKHAARAAFFQLLGQLLHAVFSKDDPRRDTIFKRLHEIRFLLLIRRPPRRARRRGSR